MSRILKSALSLLFAFVCAGVTEAAVDTAASTITNVSELIKGSKVLMAFHVYPVIPLSDLKTNPTPDDYAKAKTTVHDRLFAALKAADIDVAYIPFETHGAEMGLTYSAMLLLDCKGQEPSAALKAVPFRGAGIVFSEGHYRRGLPADSCPKIPAPHAFRQGGTGNMAQVREEKERWARLQAVKMQVLPEPPGGAGAGGSAGQVILTAVRGHTLLEVFLLTGAGFQLVDPPVIEAIAD